MSHDSAHAQILIRRSSTRGLPVEDGTGKSLIRRGEIAYSTLADPNDDGFGNGGDRLYIGVGPEIYEPAVNGNGDSVSHFYSSDINTIGGKYFTDMMNHQRGEVNAASALLVDDDKKLNELLVDFLYFDKDSVSTEATNDLHLRGGTGLTKVLGDLQVTQNVQIDGTLTVDGIATLRAGTSGTIQVGDENTDNVVFDADINSGLIPNITDTYDLGSLTQRWNNLYAQQGNFGNLDVDGLTTLDSTTIDGDLTVTKNLFVLGETTNISTTELLVEDQQIVIASGSPTAVASDGAGIAVGDSASPFAFARYANNGVDSAQWEFSPKIFAESIEFEVIDCGIYA